MKAFEETKDKNERDGPSNNGPEFPDEVIINTSYSLYIQDLQTVCDQKV